MYIVYDSFTGQTKKFALDLQLENTISISDYQSIPDGSEIFLCTRSTGFGKVPETTVRFLKDGINNHKYKIIGTAVSGNKNWGPIYGAAAKIIEEKCRIPSVIVFEASGLKSDKEKVKAYIKEYKEKHNEN